MPQSEEGRSEEETRYDEVAFVKDLCRIVCLSPIFGDGIATVEATENHHECPSLIAPNEFYAHTFCGPSLKVTVEPVERDDLPDPATYNKMQPVEFILARSDGTWTTALEKVPGRFWRNREKILRWAEVNLAGKYQDVVAWQIHAYPATEKEEGDATK